MGQWGPSRGKNVSNGSTTDGSHVSSKIIPGSLGVDDGPMFAMDGAAMSVMTGGPGLEVLAGLMTWVMRRMKPTGLLRRTVRWGFIGIRVVGFKAWTVDVR